MQQLRKRWGTASSSGRSTLYSSVAAVAAGSAGNEPRRSPDALTRHRVAGWLSTAMCDRGEIAGAVSAQATAGAGPGLRGGVGAVAGMPRGECVVKNGRRPDFRAGEATCPSARVRRCGHRARVDPRRRCRLCVGHGVDRDHDGQPEASVAAGSTHGLHGSRFKNSGTEQRTTPLRYVLSAETLT